MTKRQAAKILISNIQSVNRVAMLFREKQNFYSDIKKALLTFTYTQVEPSQVACKGLAIKSNTYGRILKGLSDYYPKNYFVLKAIEETNFDLNTLANSWHKHYQTNENYFSKPTIKNCYWAGFIAADGNIETPTRFGQKVLSLHIHKKDLSHLQLFQQELSPLRPIRFCTKQESIRFSVNSNQLCSDLYTHWNITPNKTFTLLPPNLDKSTFIKAYLIGLIDGDGTIGLYNSGPTHQYKYWQLSICLGNLNFAKWVQDFLNTGKIKLQKRDNIYGLSYHGSSALEVAKILSTPKVPRLERKWARILSELS